MTKECKLVLLGDVVVGKSASVIQYTQKYFVGEYDPTFETRFKKHIVLDNCVFLLDILDTSGDEGYSVLKESYIRSAEGIVFFYSITCRCSFDIVSILYNQSVSIKGTTTFPMVLVGNKCDLEKERQISNEEGDELAKELNCSYFETSAKDDINIDTVFYLATHFNRDKPLHNNGK